MKHTAVLLKQNTKFADQYLQAAKLGIQDIITGYVEAEIANDNKGLDEILDQVQEVLEKTEEEKVTDMELLIQHFSNKVIAESIRDNYKSREAGYADLENFCVSLDINNMYDYEYLENKNAFLVAALAFLEHEPPRDKPIIEFRLTDAEKKIEIMRKLRHKILCI